MQFTPHPGNRPDLARAQNQTPMFQESGVSIDEHKNINDNRPMASPVQRQEMKGPQISPDISNLLSGLKTKTSQPPQQPPSQQVNEAPVSIMGDNSVVSLSSVKDLDSTSLPKKTKRRNNSSRNTVSLDI